MNRKKIKIAFIAAVCGLVAGFAIFFYPGENYIKMDKESFEALKYSGENILVLKPMLTEAAYSENAFYYFFDGRCSDECLSTTIKRGEIGRWGAYNLRTVTAFGALDWPMMDDTLVHQKLLKDPKWLDKFDTVILLHNEYVTQELYDAVTSHPSVIYLMPNALYALVQYDGQRMELIRGHNYPEKEILNGFGWPHDNSKEEYDLECLSWKFREVSNGWQLSCMPEKIIIKNPNILLKVKELL